MKITHRRPTALALTLLLTFLPLLLPGAVRQACAAGQANLTLAAAPDVVFADGKSDTMITATVRGSDGSPAPDGTLVQFTASAGTLTQDTASTLAGVARVRLISGNADAQAVVSANAFLESAGGATGSVPVEFTTDREVASAGQDARWIQITCPQYLIYSADGHVIEADGKDGSAHLRDRSLTVTADSLQFDLRSQTLLAQNAVLRRGRYTLTAAHLKYDLADDTGTAVATVGTLVNQTVDLSGPAFTATPENTDQATYSTDVDIYKFADLYNSRLVISAHSISVDPGKTLQFRRATVYADGRKTLTLPYNVMPIDSLQPLGRQPVGFNQYGLTVDMPFYYHVDTQSVGTLFLRDGVTGTGNGSGAVDSTGTRTGWALDLQHTYQVGLNGSGQFLINGLTRSNWGAHWDHTQRLDSVTHTFFVVDSPDHRNLFASSNLTRQFAGFSLDTTASGSRDPSVNGYSSSSTGLNTSLATDPRALGRSGVNMVTSVAWQLGQYIQTLPGTARQTTAVSTQTASLRFFTPPLHPDAATDITDAFTIGQSWGSGRTSPTMLLSLGADRDTPLNGKLSLNYSWRYDPLYSQLNVNPNGGLPGTIYSPSQQRLTLNFAAQPTARLSMNFTGGYGLPLNDSNVYSDISYRLNPTWGVGVGEFFDRYLGNTYQETEFSLSRRILGRDLTLSYSTLTHHLTFNYLGTRF